MASKRESAKNKAASEQKADSQNESNRSKRRPRDERENAFNFLTWLVDGVIGVAEELRHGDFGLTEEFWLHFYAARREGLLATRAFIDSFVEKSEHGKTKKAERKQRRERRGTIDIDF